MGQFKDRVELRALAETYSTGVTLRDARMIASVFTDDAEWCVLPPLAVSFSGATAIGDGIAGGLMEYENLVQMLHSAHIELDGDRARMTCILQELGRRVDGTMSLALTGLYRDEAIRTRAGWRFARRTFHPLFLDSRPVEGQMFPLVLGE